MTRSVWTATTKVASAPKIRAAVDISEIPPGAKANAAVIYEIPVSLDTKYEHSSMTVINPTVPTKERRIMCFKPMNISLCIREPILAPMST